MGANRRAGESGGRNRGGRHPADGRGVQGASGRLPRYQPEPYPGAAVLFRAEVGRGRLERQWKSLCPRLQVEPVPGNHYSMLRKPNVDVLVERLNQYLAGAVDGSK